nr:hypothetical protein CFP56_42044 [Quercus suber]
MDQKRENENLEWRGVGDGHHLLELLEVDIVVAIRINGSNPPVAIFDRAFHAQAVEDEVELIGGEEAVLVLIVELEHVVELEGSAIFRVGVAKGDKLD